MSAEQTLVAAETTDGIATITLNSPANANALSTTLITQLTMTIQTALATDIRAIVLTHTGTVFCAGADLKESAAGVQLPVRAIPNLLRTMWEAPIPIVARVAGAVRGGGIGLVAAADIAICTAESSFAFSEVRVGVVPASISAVVLPRITQRAASDLMLTGRTFAGAEAQTIGLITRAVPRADLDTTITEYLNALRLGGPTALAASKRLANGQPNGSFDELAELSAHHFASAEAAEGMAARREKRPPSWA